MYLSLMFAMETYVVYLYHITAPHKVVEPKGVVGEIKTSSCILN